MKKQRLQYLAKKLIEDANNKKGIKFDLGSWVDDLNEKKPISCGTTACAFGFACFLPAFKKLGLKYDRKAKEPVFKGQYGFDAAKKFFDLELSQVMWLFSPYSYDREFRSESRGETAVADRIEMLIEHG
jgi:hypothetical protein